MTFSKTHLKSVGLAALTLLFLSALVILKVSIEPVYREDKSVAEILFGVFAYVLPGAILIGVLRLFIVKQVTFFIPVFFAAMPPIFGYSYDLLLYVFPGLYRVTELSYTAVGAIGAVVVLCLILTAATWGVMSKVRVAVICTILLALTLTAVGVHHFYFKDPVQVRGKLPAGIWW